VVLTRSNPGDTEPGMSKTDERESQGDAAPAGEVSKGLVKGQGTAIVTGAISIIFGVAYLALVQALDVRGGELQPPPPEAFLN
jgi:hypothetical protein